MPILWNKEIEEINKSGYLNKKISITDALIENFYNEILAEEEKELLNLTFEANPIQEDLDKLLSKWDIEKKEASKSLMLAYFIKRHPNLKFTKYEEPRLKGLLNFFRFRNLKTIAHYTKIGKALNKNGIEPLILKGGAMKYLRQELPRVMNDIDIVIPEKDFMKCADIISNLGYTYEKIDIHSIDFHDENGEGTVDLHKFVYMGSGHEKNFVEGLFKRARYETVFGVKSLIPSSEDMMFIALVNLAKNLRDKTSQAGILYTVYDCKFFLETTPDFNWNIVKENARKTRTEVQLNFAIKFINKLSSNILPENDMPFEKETNEYSQKVMYKRFFLEDIRTKCRAMKFKDVLKNPKQWGEYLLLKPKYIILKSFRNHPKLISLVTGEKNDYKKS